MSLLGRIFGSKKVVNGIVDTVDKAFYTDQEKADSFARVLEIYEPFKLAQRLLSLVFSVPYVVAWLATFVMAAIGFDVSSQVEILNGTMGQIVLAIVAFYFFGGVVQGVGRGK